MSGFGVLNAEGLAAVRDKALQDIPNDDDAGRKEARRLIRDQFP